LLTHEAQQTQNAEFVLTKEALIAVTPQYHLPGYLYIVANSEIFMVQVVCIQRWEGCYPTWIQLTDTPRPEQAFAAEINRDQITIWPDKRKIAFSYRESIEYQGSFEGGWDIYTLDVEECKQLEDGCDPQLFSRLTDSPHDDTSPAWIQKSEEIVYISDGELYVMQSDGSDQERVINENTYSIFSTFSSPSSSPDGKKIIFNLSTGEYRHPDTFIFTVNRDGTDLTQLTYLPHEENVNKMDLHPQISPDGLQILFESNRKPAGIYMMNIDGTDIVSLDISASGFNPKWSPDGSMIAIISFRSLAIMERSSGVTLIYISGVDMGNFIWAP
jgi:Tol biopolymer transport system component